MTRVAVAQFRPEFGQALLNAERIAAIIADTDADLIVFPEAAITGYCFRSKEEATNFAVPLDFPGFTAIQSVCSATNRYAIVGLAEKAADKLHNSALFLGPSGRVGVYRKTHLPWLGLDRFVEQGNELKVFDTPIGKIGVLICFDIRMPEPCRALSLQGADIVCLPTNWPDSAQPSSDVICPARTLENHVYLAAANRVGDENGFHFIGRSKIIAPGGHILAALDNTDEGVAITEVDFEKARAKRVVREAGVYELDLFGARRPELYSNLTQRP